MQISRIIRCLSISIALGFSLAVLFTAGSAWASFPGRNGRIVFVANTSGSWQLHTINPDGTDMAQITNMAATSFNSWFPSFSPDGKRIVFSYGQGVLFSDAKPDLYMINADGTGLTQLTNDGLSFWPRWSPDGTSVVFARFSATGDPVVVTMRTDGSDNTVLTTDVWNSFGATYTPEGKHIVFDSQKAGFVSVVWIMRPDGSNQKRLTDAPLELGPTDVSPDGQHLLLISHNNVNLPEAIYATDIDGGTLKRLTYASSTMDGDMWPTYSPDGTKIAFVSDRLNSSASLDLFTMNADGSDIERIATGLTVGSSCGPDNNCVTPSWGRAPR